METKPNALTTVERVRQTRLRIDSENFDDLFVMLIDSVSDFIEGECNRKFMEAEYEEIIIAHSNRESTIVLKNAPVTEIAAVEYRAGSITDPNWMEYWPDNWELLDEESGIIEMTVALERASRVTYTAGYVIDWKNTNDPEKHTLPSDLTDLAERMVVKLFKRREAEGKASESFDRTQITWSTSMADEDKAVLARYRRIPALS